MGCKWSLVQIQSPRPSEGPEVPRESVASGPSFFGAQGTRLGGDIASAGTAVVVRPQRPTSILLSDELKAALRKRGQQLGVGYQTAAKMILARYVNAKL